MKRLSHVVLGMVAGVAASLGCSAADSADEAARTALVSDEAIAVRKQMVIEAGAADDYLERPGRHPKHRDPVVMCRLALDPENESAWKYVPVGMLHRGGADHFTKSNLAQLTCKFGHLFTPEMTEKLRKEVTTFPLFFHGGTENHVSMYRTAAFLFAERFPNETFHFGLSSRRLADACRDYMRKYGRTIYATGTYEYMSPTYHAVNTAPWINIVEYAKDDTAKLMARAILDWFMADYAQSYLHGHMLAPAARAKGLLGTQYQTSYARTPSQWTGWLYWGGGTTPQQGTFSDPKYLPLQPYARTGVLHALMDWNPHPIIRNIGAKRVRLPYSIRQSHGSWDCIDMSQVNAYGKTKSRHTHPAAFFLREGDVYIAVRPLATGAAWQQTSYPGFVRLAMPGSRVGFAIEVGDKREFGSFEAFQKKIASTELDVSQLASARRATYRSTRGDVLALRHTFPDRLPEAVVNGVTLDFDRWPTSESPYVTCRDRVLDVNDGRQGFTVDWRGDVPKYAYYDITDAGRKITKRQHIKNGKLTVSK